MQNRPLREQKRAIFPGNVRAEESDCKEHLLESRGHGKLWKIGRGLQDLKSDQLKALLNGGKRSKILRFVASLFLVSIFTYHGDYLPYFVSQKVTALSSLSYISTAQSAANPSPKLISSQSPV